MTTVSTPSGGAPAGRAIIPLVITAAAVLAVVLLLPEEWYLWAKAFHVIAVIAWMVGLLYLPRLFVYHTAASPGSEASETFKVMERRLLRAIVNPAMVVTWVLGLWLAVAGDWFTAGWLHGKLLLVVLLSGLHGYLAGGVRRFAEDRNTRSQRHWRIVNEVPTVLLIGIVILVIVKPF